MWGWGHGCLVSGLQVCGWGQAWWMGSGLEVCKILLERFVTSSRLAGLTPDIMGHAGTNRLFLDEYLMRVFPGYHPSQFPESLADHPFIIAGTYQYIHDYQNHFHEIFEDSKLWQKEIELPQKTDLSIVSDD